MTQTVSLGDICTKVTSGGTPSTKHDEYYGGDVPWLRTQEVNFSNIYSTEKTITEAGLKNSSAKLIPENSVIIAMYGATAGKSAINKIPLTTNQACCNLIIDSKKADYRFVYYYLLNNYEKLLGAATGAAQQNLGAKQIAAMLIELPDLETQRKIANILGAVDEKIELNRRMNETLEQTGQALFRHYFIDNPGAEKWEKVKLSNISSYISRGISPKYDENGASLVVNQRCIRDARLSLENGRRQSKSISDEKLLRKGDVLINSTGVGTLGRVAQVDETLENVTFDSHITVVRPSIDSYFFGQLMRNLQSRFEDMGSGTTGQTELSRVAVGEVEIKLPPAELIAEFRARLAPLRESMYENDKQIQTLTALRDTLLPRLINGKMKL